MPVQQTWRVRCLVPRGGGDLVLDGLDAVTGQSCPIASIVASHPPVSGDLDGLINASTRCRFAAEDVALPGFYLEITLVEAAALWGVRFLSGDAACQPVTYMLEAQSAEKDAVLLGALAYDPWSQQPSAEPSFMQASGWRVESALTGNNLLYIFASGDGRVRFVSNYSPALAMSTDYGQNYFYAAPYRVDRAWVSYDGALAYLSSATTGVYRCVGTWFTLIAGSASWGTCDPAVALGGSKVLLASNAALRLSTDSGATWSTLTVAGFTNGFSSCDMSEDGQTLVVTRSTNRVYLSTDGGAAWAEVASAYTGAPMGKPCVSKDGNTILLRADSSYARVSRNRGVTWTVITSIVPTSTTIGRALSADGKWALLANASSIALCDIEKMTLRFMGHPWPSSTYNTSGLGLAGNGSLMMVTVMTNATATANFYTNWLPDYVYQRAEAVPDRSTDVQGVTLVDGVVFSTEVAALTQHTDDEDGGQGTIYGTVAIKADPTNTLVARRVRLRRSVDGQPVRETWSDSNGVYRFDGINRQYEYDVEAWDHTGNMRSVLANNVTPEKMA